jgi:hypothetical protein
MDQTTETQRTTDGRGRIETGAVPNEPDPIALRILIIRGQRVLLDVDLAGKGFEKTGDVAHTGTP